MSVIPRLIPDTECVQGKCACTTTGCWDVCSMKRMTGTFTLAPSITIGTGTGIAAVPDTRIADLETALRAAQATIGGLEMEVARLTVEAGGLPQHIPGNFTTHRMAWRDAITECVNREMAQSERAMYWKHELAAYDRAFARLLDNPEPARPTVNGAGETTGGAA